MAADYPIYRNVKVKTDHDCYQTAVAQAQKDIDSKKKEK